MRMSEVGTGWRLAGFGVLLVAVFLAALVVGRAVGDGQWQVEHGGTEHPRTLHSTTNEVPR